VLVSVLALTVARYSEAWLEVQDRERVEVAAREAQFALSHFAAQASLQVAVSAHWRAVWQWLEFSDPGIWPFLDCCAVHGLSAPLR
jgi:hypothetical protein